MISERILTKTDINRVTERRATWKRKQNLRGLVGGGVEAVFIVIPSCGGNECNHKRIKTFGSH